MIRGKGALFGVFVALLLMTVVFTATSADSLGRRTVDAASDGLVVVNGDGISEDEFIARVATVEQNVVTLRAQAELEPEPDPAVEEFLGVMEATAPETIALASLILDVAVYQEAVRLGFQPDAGVVEEQVQQERELFGLIEEDPDQFGIEHEAVEEYREYIDSIGEERYWSEFYPQMLEQQTAVQQLQAAVANQGLDWSAMQQEIFRTADIDVRDDDAISPASVSAAGDYLETIWSVTGQP